MKIYALENFNSTLDIKAYDKSISHRFAIFSLLSNQESKARNFLFAEDTLNSLEIIKALGAKVSINKNTVKICPPKEIQEVNKILYCGNSGTTMRLLLGLLAAQKGFFVLSGDEFLNKRPMKRLTNPLEEIGAKINGVNDKNLAPLCIQGSSLKAFNYQSQISSAQVKTAMILAGLHADGTSYYSEPFLSRDHSENMLKAMDAPIQVSTQIQIKKLTKPLKPLNITIANDPSSAFYFALAAVILKNSKIELKNVLLNKTRIEAFKILKQMGANIEIKIKENTFEQVGDIYASSSSLKAVNIETNIAWLIDELPALSIAFALAKGKSKVTNAKELRVKESNRIASIVNNLKLCKAKAKELENGFEIQGSNLEQAKIKSYSDHRIAMSFAILGLVCGIEIDDTECVKTSFSKFL